MSNHQLSSVLAKYIPEPAVPICTHWIVTLNIHLRISRNRSTLYGNYQPNPNGPGHLITVNHNLNRYAFLITFIHEVAHLLCHRDHSRGIAPHGKEWKYKYSVLLNYFLKRKIFPRDIDGALRLYAKNPAASSCSDDTLLRVLKKYDAPGINPAIHLEELEAGSLFRLGHASRLLFKKGERMRKRFRCVELNSKMEYHVSGLMEVVRVDVAVTGELRAADRGQ